MDDPRDTASLVPHDPDDSNCCPIDGEEWPCAERKRQRATKKEAEQMLRSDLFKVADPLPDDPPGVRWSSPLGWSVWMTYGESGVPMAVRWPDSRPFASTTSGSAEWLEGTLP